MVRVQRKCLAAGLLRVEAYRHTGRRLLRVGLDFGWKAAAMNVFNPPSEDRFALFRVQICRGALSVYTHQNPWPHTCSRVRATPPPNGIPPPPVEM